RQQERERRFARGQSQRDPTTADDDTGTEKPAQDPGGDIGALLKQTRQPEFISSAYFLRFRFEEGKYALVGREKLDGRDVLRIEYYPSKLYSDDHQRREGGSHDQQDPWDAEMQRLLNKVALVTLWVEPAAHQIVKYTFDN